jgi:uncharacterized membrane protein YhaH (DUF805 family)
MMARSRNFLFSFRGRIGRARFWLYFAIVAPLYLVLVVAFWVYALSIPGAYENGGPTPFPTDPLGILGAIVFFLVLAVTTLAGAAITVKRLHDRDKAWWWLVIFVVAPDVLLFLAEVLAQSELLNDVAAFAIEFAALAIATWGSVELGMLRGTAGANRFGPDPLTSTR